MTFSLLVRDPETGALAGTPAPEAVARITGADRNRGDRQLSALDLSGQGAAFTGANNTDAKGALIFANGVVAGNLLSDLKVLQAIRDGYQGATGSLPERLLAGLMAGRHARGDSRGLLSAALLVLDKDHAPLTLRVDYHDSDPLGALRDLYTRATSGDYAFWARQVPSLSDPERGLD